MSRLTTIRLMALLASCLTWACVGDDLDRHVDQDTEDDGAVEDGGIEDPYEGSGEGSVEDSADAGPSSDGDAVDEGVEPVPEVDGGLEPEGDGGHRDDDDGSDGACLPSCAVCVIGADECCEHDICQDDWSGVPHCMPIIPPQTRECPSEVPTDGSPCSLRGVLCRYTAETRCKCGCDGWNCPFGD